MIEMNAVIKEPIEENVIILVKKMKKKLIMMIQIVFLFMIL